MGGAKEYSNTPNKLKAKSLVMQLWNLFGVGTGIDPAFRPFGKVIVHGFDISKSVFLRINSSNPNQHTLDNEDHSTKNYNIFVSLLRQTMSTDTSKKKTTCPPHLSVPSRTDQSHSKVCKPRISFLCNGITTLRAILGPRFP